MARTAENETSSFESILDMPMEMAERPKPLPQGSYITILVGLPGEGVSSQRQTPYSEFTHKIVSAAEDVDEDKLDEFLTSPDGEKRTLQDVTIKNKYYQTKSAMYRLRDFLTHCGVEEENGKSFSQAIADTPGCEVGIHIRHRPWENGEGVSADIDRTFPVKS